MLGKLVAATFENFFADDALCQEEGGKNLFNRGRRSFASVQQELDELLDLGFSD